ncbi:MAG: hypothetical protein ACXADY_18575 [Candidatus Hodarchaeales archaeon]|jgi:hypothetical protein
MQSNILNRSSFGNEQPVINGHEMLLFEADIAWNSIKGWAMNQYLDQKGLLFYDGDAINQTFLESVFQSDNDTSVFQKLMRHSSIRDLFRLMNRKKFEKIREILRNQIWEAIKRDNILGVSYVFNFDRYIMTDKCSVLNFERILRDLFQNKFGFPIDCCCLYPSTINVLDFAELVDLHNGYQIFDKFQHPRLKHYSYSNQIRGCNNNENEMEQPPISIDLDDSLSHIAKRALSGSNSPFYFCKSEQVIGVANDLESFYEQLEIVPLDVFCFHCYRTTRSNLAGKSISPSTRSDIALWIEYSVGDTQLAHQIYDTVSRSLGDRIKTLESGSKFSQLTIKSTVLKLIKSRIDYLSFGDFK